MRRRFMIYKDQSPKLVKLTSNPGIDQNYTIENGYRYFDLLVVGGGGAGGINSGGGGGSGLIIYVKDFIIKNLQSKQIVYNIAPSVATDSHGKNTVIVFDGKQIQANGGKRGTIGGFGSIVYYGDGADLNTEAQQILSKYVSDPSLKIAMCSNGGGAAGSYRNKECAAGGSGASMSSNGRDGSDRVGGRPVSNTDGTGGYNGGYCKSYGGNSYRGGVGRRLNSIIIPIKSIFQGGGQSGDSYDGTVDSGSGSGGGAAAYGSGGNGGASGIDNPTNGTDGGIGAGGGGGGGLSHKGGKGGQGIICLYYHN